MNTKVYTIDEKLQAIEDILISERKKATANGTSARGSDRYRALQAVAADLRARQQHARSNTLGELGRQVAAVKASKTALGYSNRHLETLGNAVIGKWPLLSQALEQFGEESAE